MGYAATRGTTMYTWAIMTVFILVSSAWARELPSEVDLRAAYCIPIAQHWVSDLRPLATDPTIKEPGQEDLANLIEDFNEILRRLQLYLMPRIRHLDSLGLTTAMKRGQEDRDKLVQYNATCSTKCKPLKNKKPLASWTSCLDKCHAENPLKSRLEACSDLRWLPF